jgi:hypothetical protein
MKIAIITFPKDIIYPDANPHYWWHPAEHLGILEYWTGSCKIEFISDEDYDKKKAAIYTSIYGRLQTIADLISAAGKVFKGEATLTYDSHTRIILNKSNKKTPIGQTLP